MLESDSKTIVGEWIGGCVILVTKRTGKVEGNFVLLSEFTGNHYIPIAVIVVYDIGLREGSSTKCE